MKVARCDVLRWVLGGGGHTSNAFKCVLEEINKVLCVKVGVGGLALIW